MPTHRHKEHYQGVTMSEVTKKENAFSVLESAARDAVETRAARVFQQLRNVDNEADRILEKVTSKVTKGKKYIADQKKRLKDAYEAGDDTLIDEIGQTAWRISTALNRQEDKSKAQKADELDF